jgi:hypothetical protein
MFHCLFAEERMRNKSHAGSVADPGCLSRIPDPKTATKERGEKKFVVITFYVATNFTKLQIILVLGQFSKNYRNFYPKNCH